MDEEKERFFLAVMFDIGPPPVDNTRQGTLVGTKGRPEFTVRFTQRAIFVDAMVRLMGSMKVAPFKHWMSADDMYYAYTKWYEAQERFSRAAARL